MPESHASRHPKARSPAWVSGPSTSGRSDRLCSSMMSPSSSLRRKICRSVSILDCVFTLIKNPSRTWVKQALSGANGCGPLCPRVTRFLAIKMTDVERTPVIRVVLWCLPLRELRVKPGRARLGGAEDRAGRGSTATEAQSWPRARDAEKQFARSEYEPKAWTGLARK